MTEHLQLKKSYSFLKMSSLILTKELSLMKERNDYLNQRVNELELELKGTTSKEEMREMIKEELAPITNILIGKEKEMTETQTQTEKIVIINKNNKATYGSGRVQEVLQSEDLHTNIWSLIETEDKRIASGGEEGNISISSYDINKKTWNRDIHKEKAHNDIIYSLCTLKGNRLLSSSADNSLKIWSISDIDLIQIKEIKEHANLVWKVIPLSKERFASCSGDWTVKIWKDDETYKCLSTLKHYGCVRSILQLRGKETLVTCGYYSSTGVSFWDLNTYTRQEVIKGCGIDYSSHMIELSDGNIALSSADKCFPIVIIDSELYQIKIEFLWKEYIAKYSALYLLNNHSFIYTCEGTFLQISSDDYSILYQSTGGKFSGYYGGIISIDKGKYLAVESGKKITIIKFSEF